MRRFNLKLIAINILAWTIAIIWLTPFIGLFMTSIRPFKELTHGWWSLEQFHVTAENYFEAFNRGMGKYLINSLIITVPSTVIPIFVAALSAYAFSRFSFPIKDMLFLTLVFIQIIPSILTLIPLTILLREAKLLNTIAGLVLIHTAFSQPWITFFLRNFLLTLPKEIEEAAKIDGCSDIQIFSKIVLPLSAPALGSVASIQFLLVWNEFLFALIFLKAPDLWPVTIGVTVLSQSQYIANWGLLSAASIIAISVPLALFLVIQKYYIRGLVMGAVKG